MFKKIIPISSISIWFYLVSTTSVFAAVPEELTDALATLWDQYWFYIAIFVSLGVLTGLLAFIVLFIRMGANSSNPQERSRIFKEMMAVGITTAALGGITFIVTLYLTLFN